MNPQCATISPNCLMTIQNSTAVQAAIHLAACTIPITTAIFNRNQLINTQIIAFCLKAFFAVNAFNHFVRHRAHYSAKTTFRTGTWVCFNVPSKEDQNCQVGAFWGFKASKSLQASAVSEFPNISKAMRRSVRKHFTTNSTSVGPKSDPFVYFHKIKPIATTTQNINGGLLTCILAISYSVTNQQQF